MLTCTRNGQHLSLTVLLLPVCKRAHAARCKKVRVRPFCGYYTAKKEKFFVWRLHSICTATEISVRFEVLPVAKQDLMPIHELTFGLPEGYISDPDAAVIFTATCVRFVAAHRRNMTPNSWADDYDLRF